MTQEENWLLHEKYAGKESEAFFADLTKLKAGEPLAYLIGHIPFLDCEISLDSKPLIPRPETEYWVKEAINEIKTVSTFSTSPIKVLDLCAGSGAIGVAVAKAIPLALVTFAEIDSTHLPTITKNLKNNTIIYDSEKYPLIVSDLFNNLTHTDKFDFILSNPPYIDPVIDRTETSVKKHEPHLALYGGKAGTELIEKIIIEAPKYLSLNGQLWLEHEPEQITEINEWAKENFKVTNHDDQYGVKRYSTLIYIPAKTMAK